MKLEKSEAYLIDEIDQWQIYLLSHMGITASMSPEVRKESCRKILLETSRLYINMNRLEAGMDPIRRGEE